MATPAEDEWKDEDFLSFHDDRASRPSSLTSGSSPLPPSNPSASSSSRPVGDHDNPNDASRDDDDESGGDDDEEEDEEGPSSSSVLPPWMDQVNPEYMRNQQQQQQQRSNGRAPPAAVVPPLVRLHNEIIGYACLVEPTSQERSVRENLVRRVQQLAISVFGKQAQVLVFGSQSTRLYLPTSDIDLVILTKPEAEVKKEKEIQKDRTNHSSTSFDPTPLRRFASGLREAWERTSELSYLEVIENTRVPLVKFTHRPTNTSIDVSFDLPDSGPPAATLMNTYLEALPPLRPLTLVTKSLLAARGLNQPYTGGVGSYMLQIMIVAFLQHRERDAVIFRRRPSLNLGALLLDFLEFYGLDFNYVTTGISVRNDGFFFPKGVPSKKEWFYAADRNQLMAIENPLDTVQDVGKSSFRISTVQRAFKVMHNVLLGNLSEPSSSTTATNTSILATILPVTPEMVQRGRIKRRLLRRQLRRQSSANKPSNSSSSSGRGGPPSVLNQPLSSKRHHARDEGNPPPASSPSSNQRGRKRPRR